MSHQRKSARKKRQTQITFTPLPSSSPAASDSPDQNRRRAAAVRYDGDVPPIKKRRVLADSSPDVMVLSSIANQGSSSSRQLGNIQVVIESPSKKASQLPTPAASSQVEVGGGELQEVEAEISPSRKLSKKDNGINAENPRLAGTSTTMPGNFSQDFNSEEDDQPVRSFRKPRPTPITITSSSGDSPEPVMPSSRSRPTFSTPRSARSFLLGGNSGCAPISSSRLREIVTPRKRLRPYPSADTQTSKVSAGSDTQTPTRNFRQRLSLSPVRSGLKPRKGALGMGKTSVISDENANSSTEEDIVVSPARRRRNTAQPRSLTQKPKNSKGDSGETLQEEVENLNDTELRRTRTRGRQENSERNIRQQKLDELRRRRAGITDLPEEESGQGSSEEASESGPEPIHHAMRRGGNLDEYEADFVDDEDDTVGVDLGREGVPLEFTYHANKKPFENFKTEIEWMVHNKINPAFDRRDEIYELAHRKLDDEVHGYAGSKFSSSVWKEDFNKALRGRPEFYRADVPTMLEHKCDACQRSGHPPKHKVTLSGKAYDRETLENIESDDEEDDESDDESSEEGSSSSVEDKQNFFLGRNCCANAETAHALHHWRYALNQTILEWLTNNGHLTPEKIVEREGMRRKKREKSAHKIVDAMEETGVTKILYKEFKENLEAARSDKPERFSDNR